MAEITWSPKKLLLIEIRANSLENRTDEEIASDIGISPRTLYRWQNTPGFWDAVYGRAQECLKSRLPEILKAQADKAIQRQDTFAARLCLEACGMINSKVKLEHSGEVKRIYDVITKFTDEELDREIAALEAALATTRQKT